jgi:hypothetical protein
MKTKTISISLPKKWDDLTSSQLISLCALFAKEIGQKKFDIGVFKILMGIRPWRFAKRAVCFEILRNVPISELKQHFSFIYGKNTRTVFPEITIPGTKVFPPLDRLSNLSANEFSVADDFHIKYRETKNIEYLYYLAATLYVREKQPRPEFDKNNLEESVLKFRTLGISELMAIELAFAGCKEHIAGRYKKAFPTGGKKSAKKFGFGKVILEMAGKKFGTHRETGQTNIYTFLTEFEENLNKKPVKR